MIIDLTSQEADFEEQDKFAQGGDPFKDKPPVEEAGEIPQDGLQELDPIEETDPLDTQEVEQEMPEVPLQDEVEDRVSSDEEEYGAELAELEELTASDNYNTTDLRAKAEEDLYSTELAELDGVGNKKPWFAESTWATLSDVGRGLVEGAGLFVGEAAEAAAWVNQQADKLDPISVGMDFITGFGKEREALHNVGREKADEFSTLVDETFDLKTQLGEATSGVSQFVGAFLGAGKFTRGMKAIQQSPKIIQGMTKGALADFLGFDEHQANLAEVVKGTGLRSDIIDYLVKDEDEGFLEGRFKNAVQGLVAGVAGEAVFSGVRVMKKLAPAGWKKVGDEAVPRTAQDQVENMVKSLPKEAQEKFKKQVGTGYTITRDKALQIYQSNLLGVGTQVLNTISNSLTAVSYLGEKAIARGVSAVDEKLLSNKLLGGDGVAAGELGAHVAGMWQGAKEGIDLMAKAFKTGESTFGVRNKLDIEPKVGRVFNPDTDSLLGHGLKTMGDLYLNITPRALVAGDDFFKSVNYRGELYSRAVRQATKEGYTGKKLEQRIERYLKNPSKQMTTFSEDLAHENTFTSHLGKFAKPISEIRRKIPETKFAVPFYDTIANVTKWSFERFPMTTALFRNNREAWARGGADKAMVLGKAGMGSLYGTAMMGLYQSGFITGPDPDEWRKRVVGQAAGKQANSFKIGDTHVDFSKYEPIGKIFTLWNSTMDLVNHMTHPEDKETVEDVIMNSMLAIGSSVAEGSFAEGLNETLSVVLSGDEKQVKKFMADKFSRMIPVVGSDISRRIAQVVDPTIRDAQDFISKVAKGIPGLSGELPAKYDIYGRELEYNAGGVPGFFGFRTQKETPDIYDDYFAEQGFELSPPTYSQIFDGTRVNLREYPEVYSEMMKLSGEVEHPDYFGQTMSDHLNEVVRGEGFAGALFENMTHDDQQKYVKKVLADYRKAAREKIAMENEEFAMAIQSEKTLEELESGIYSELLR